MGQSHSTPTHIVTEVSHQESDNAVFPPLFDVHRLV